MTAELLTISGSMLPCAGLWLWRLTMADADTLIACHSSTDDTAQAHNPAEHTLAYRCKLAIHCHA